MSDLLARLIAAGTPADLIAEVAMEIARADVVRRQEAEEAERKEKRRADNARRQREFKARNRSEVTQGNADNALPASANVTEPALSPSPLPSPHTPQLTPRPHTHPDNNPVREAVPDLGKPANASRSKPPHRMPEGWEPVLTDAAKAIVDSWPPGMLDQQVAAFRDHAADKGRTSKDWQAAFRTWITNANRWKPANDRSSAHRSQHQPYGDGLTEALRRRGAYDGLG